ncbi:MAG: hypothetical protein H0X36_11740 [Sphingomonadaceae bacterium]|nr:hypothetical protein [Sphingomonadaceae bacterium]
MTLRIACFALCLAAQPAAAQVFWQPPDFHGAPIVPGETGIGVALPGATAEEERAAIAWQMRSGLNVAALQCQFDPLLLTRDSYNGLLMNHRDELAQSYGRLGGYFKRTYPTAKAAQTALDQYGTKTYTGFSTVRAQLSFCQTASGIARGAMFTPRGSFTIFAVERLRELRNGLVQGGEQAFRFGPPRVNPPPLPSFDNKCWTSKNVYKVKCGYPA